MTPIEMNGSKKEASDIQMPFLNMDVLAGNGQLPNDQHHSEQHHYVNGDNASGGDYEDEEEDEEADEPEEEGQSSSEVCAVLQNPKSEMQEIKGNLKWLNHQMRMLMQTFTVPFCKCQDCAATGLNAGAPQHHIQHTKSEVSLSAVNGSQNDSMNFSQSSEMGEVNSSGLEGNTHFGGDLEYQKRGRRSKYCTPQERKMVARYAQMYGASSAARKFGIPPAVAAYYHRKEYRKGAAQLTDASGHNLYPKPALKIPPIAGDNRIDSEGHQQQDNNGSGEAVGGETGNINQLVNQVASGEMGENWMGSGGNCLSQQHAFLRGRGRGRPKLIGDELDAELVEWMSLLKQANPGQHINASQALVLARNYIMEKSPGLLAENGGQVKLRITWAMKLLNRVVEREREIQMGLPPGTLQNMSRINNSGNTSAAATSGGFGSTLDELQQIFGQVSNFQQQGGSSKNSFMGQGMSDGGEETSPEQLLADLSSNGGIDNELIQKLLGNLQGQAESLGFPPSSAGTSSANDFLAQATGAFC